ncbi:MAG: hypothetical protein ABW120_16065, partial [Sedimenticola sp.]
MTKLIDAEVITPLLRIAQYAEQSEVRIAALDAASRFPLTTSAWHNYVTVADEIVAAFPEGSEPRRDALTLLARVPLLSVRLRLRHLADDAEDADRELIIQALEQAGDSSQIEPLLQKARAGDESVFEQLAAMPLEDADLDYLAIPAVPQDASADTLFWHALVMARVGNLVELDTFFRTADNTPDFFQGSPWTAYDVIANIRPVPDLMQQYLLRAIELFA